MEKKKQKNERMKLFDKIESRKKGKKSKEKVTVAAQPEIEPVSATDISMSQDKTLGDLTQAKKAESTASTRKKKPAKDKTARPYDEILADLTIANEKNSVTIDRCVSLLLELKQIKGVSYGQVKKFFDAAEESLQDAWAPFLTKAFLNVSPDKSGNDYLILGEILQRCHTILESCGLDPKELEDVGNTFLQDKDETHITKYLSEVDPSKHAAAGKKRSNLSRQIDQQELACTSYIMLINACRDYAPSSDDLLIKAERAIAEFFSICKMKEQAGKTVGNVISSRTFSPKKIAELTYLYTGTLDTIRKQSEQNAEHIAEIRSLETQNSELHADLKFWKQAHADLLKEIQEMESENQLLSKAKADAENMLEFERNKYQLQMQTKEAGIAEQLSEDLKLEIQAIKETVEYIDEDNKRRIQRRLQRIDKILHEFGGEENA